MGNYRIPEPRECFECGGKCYARDWSNLTPTGKAYPKDMVRVQWQCSECGHRFKTLERLNDILARTLKG